MKPKLGLVLINGRPPERKGQHFVYYLFLEASIETASKTTQILGLRPTMSDTVTLYNEADKLKDAGDLDGAVAKLQEALEVDETYSLAHAALAVVEQKRGNHDQAIEHAKKVCDLEPNDAFSYTALSVTYQRAYAGTGEMSYIQMAEDAMAKSREMEMHR